VRPPEEVMTQAWFDSLPGPITGPNGTAYKREWLFMGTWTLIVRDLISDLFSLGWDGNLAQMKEKFGGLRFYIGGGSDAIFDRIDQAEADSFRVCEGCGKPGNPRGGPWIRTLCDDCNEKE
jgi:hypothetical protein